MYLDRSSSMAAMLRWVMAIKKCLVVVGLQSVWIGSSNEVSNLFLVLDFPLTSIFQSRIPANRSSRYHGFCAEMEKGKRTTRQSDQRPRDPQRAGKGEDSRVHTVEESHEWKANGVLRRSLHSKVGS